MKQAQVGMMIMIAILIGGFLYLNARVNEVARKAKKDTDDVFGVEQTFFRGQDKINVAIDEAMAPIRKYHWWCNTKHCARSRAACEEFKDGDCEGSRTAYCTYFENLDGWGKGLLVCARSVEGCGTMEFGLHAWPEMKLFNTTDVRAICLGGVE